VQPFFAGRVDDDPAVGQGGEGEDQRVDLGDLVLCAIPAGRVPDDAPLGRCRRGDGTAAYYEMASGEQQG